MDRKSEDMTHSGNLGTDSCWMSTFSPLANDGAFDASTYSGSHCEVMSPASKPSARTVREQVDRRISELESEIRALKTHRNSVADTSRLPPEILSKIFIILKRTYHSREVSWLKVTWVCKHWRAVALEYTSLWADLNFVNPALTEAMLQRSRDAPLQVTVNETLSSTFNEILCRLTSQTSRLQVLELDESSMLDLPKILSNFDSAAPILEKLRLRGPYFHFVVQGHKDYFIPASFLQNGAPCLRHLEITRFALHWNALPLFTTLTHLSLSHVGPEKRLSRTSFFRGLAKLRQLETLKLSAYLPLSTDVSQPNCLPITLPSLRSLVLHDPAMEILQFLSQIQIPKEAKFDIELSDEALTVASVESIFLALRECWTLSNDVEVGTAVDSARPSASEIRVDSRPSWGAAQIMCWFDDGECPSDYPRDHPDDPDDLDEEIPPTANLVVSARSGPNLLLEMITGYLNISSLRCLHLASAIAIPSRATLALFKDLVKLEQVIIEQSHAALSNFLRALKKKKHGSRPFPSLRTFELNGVDFDENRVREADIAVAALATALKSRMKYVPAIAKFSVVNCANFTEEDWEVLCRALPREADLYWDEVENITGLSDWDEYFDGYTEESTSWP